MTTVVSFENEAYPGGEEFLRQVDEHVTGILKFSPLFHYFQSVDSPEMEMTNDQERIKTNCGMHSAEAAKFAESKGLSAYLCQVNSHGLAVMVAPDGIHVASSDPPSHSRANVEKLGVFDDRTLQAISDGVNYTYTDTANPMPLLIEGRELQIQAWASSNESRAALFKWPKPGHDYLMLHSRMRYHIKRPFIKNTFDELNIDSAIRDSREFRPFDVTTNDDTPDSYRTVTMINPKNNQPMEVSYPMAERLVSMTRSAQIARTEDNLRKLGVLTDVFYSNDPSYLVTMSSERQYAQAAATYIMLADRAFELGFGSLRDEFMAKAGDPIQI